MRIRRSSNDSRSADGFGNNAEVRIGKGDDVPELHLDPRGGRVLESASHAASRGDRGRIGCSR